LADYNTGRRTVKAIVVTDQAAGTAGMTLVERPEPQAAINDVVVQIHASGFVPTEMAWPSTWTDRLDRDRTPSIPGHELAGVVTALGYGTTGLSVGVAGELDEHLRPGNEAERVCEEFVEIGVVPGDVRILHRRGEIVPWNRGALATDNAGERWPDLVFTGLRRVAGNAMGREHGLASRGIIGGESCRRASEHGRQDQTYFAHRRPHL
jgi:hypothetical protein